MMLFDNCDLFSVFFFGFVIFVCDALNKQTKTTTKYGVVTDDSSGILAVMLYDDIYIIIQYARNDHIREREQNSTGIVRCGHATQERQQQQQQHGQYRNINTRMHSTARPTHTHTWALNSIEIKRNKQKQQFQKKKKRNRIKKNVNTLEFAESQAQSSH